ncbi:MAG: T9SS type A sorting domain-containing protein [Bacteroidota bacterium]
MKIYQQLIWLSLFALLGSWSLTAQPHRKASPEQKAHRTAVKEYLEANVLPVVAAERETFEQELSAADQRELQQIRGEMERLRANRKNHRQARRPAKGEARPEPTEAQRAEMKAHKKAQRLLMTRAWNIADAYETEIEAHLETLRPQAEVWKEELKQLHESHRPSEAPPGEHAEEAAHPRPHRGGKHGTRGPHHGQGHRGAKGMFRPLHSPVAFLLFDPSAPQPFEEQEVAPKLLTYPNPASTATTVNLDLKQAGTVHIDLVDPQGNVVKSWSQAKQSAGEKQIQLPLEGIEAGVYLIRVQTAAGVQSEKIVIE